MLQGGETKGGREEERKSEVDVNTDSEGRVGLGLVKEVGGREGLGTYYSFQSRNSISG